MPNSFLNIQDNLKRLIECYVEKEQTSVANRHLPHTHLSEPQSQSTYILEPKTIYTYIDTAREKRNPLLNLKAFYIHDLKDHQQTPYNSLIFDIDGYCYKTKDKTSQIIDRFATYNDKPYELIQTIGQMLGITQKCPYVIGEMFFAPDRGTSRNEANWIGLHHLITFETSDFATHLSFKNNHHLALPINKSAVTNMIERAFILHRLEQIFLYNYLKNYDRNHLVTSRQNVVNKMSHNINFATKIPSNLEVLSNLSFIKAIEVAAKIMGVSHLTTDEIEEYYPEWRKEK